MILLLDNFDSFTYNLYQMLQAQTDETVEVHRNNALTFTDIRAMRPAGIIISPGPGHPANAADVGVCADVLTYYNELACPLLGVCLGQQLIAHHFGAEIIHAPTVMHGKTSVINVIRSSDTSPIFEAMPDTFEVMRYHSLVVSPENLPDDLLTTATTTDGVVMALQHQTLPIYGVQFHPESIGTPTGNQLLGNFLKTCRQKVPA